MKIRSFVTTYAKTSNQHNYFMNGLIKDDISENCCVDFCDISKIRNLYALADSGKSDLGGEGTAYLCMDMMCEILGSNFETQRYDYFDAVHTVVKGRAFEQRCEKPRVDLGALYIEGTSARAYNAGEISIFHYRNGKLEKISGKMPETVEDEVLSDENSKMVIKKVVKPTAPYVGALTDSYGVVPYVSERIKIKENDFFVIVTESVASLINEQEIQKILSDKDIAANKKAQAIVNCASQKDSDGNYTAEVIEVCDDFKIAGMKPSVITGIIALVIILAAIFSLSATSGDGDSFIDRLEESVNNFMYGNDDDSNNTVKQWVPIERTSQ